MAKRKKSALADTVAGERPSARRKGSGPVGQKMPAANSRAKLQNSWKSGGDADAAKEHTKPDDVRATIRATASRHWTNRQAGKG
jgi:hypothetical protein